VKLQYPWILLSDPYQTIRAVGNICGKYCWWQPIVPF